jgi:UDP-N-acetyl-D-galactosamine dehydrogenase
MKICVIGLGYVGLPLCHEMAKHHEFVIGYDVDRFRIDELHQDKDRTGELSREELKGTKAHFTHHESDLADCDTFIVTVPTPVDEYNVPDTKPIERASKLVGKYLKEHSVVIFESTVWPGLTNNLCVALLEMESGLTEGVDLSVGYSPERVSPGDPNRTVTKIKKIIAANDAHTLTKLRELYGPVISAGLHECMPIEVGEMAKIIENCQRDINIGFINEVAMLCDRMELNTHDVLDAARTKFNWVDVKPGLVGGHCIGVDPYYLTHEAKRIGFDCSIITSGRNVNEKLPAFIAAKVAQLGAKRDARIYILGKTFKENCPDKRNSKVPQLIQELFRWGFNNLTLHDPYMPSLPLNKADVLILAVGHREYVEKREEVLEKIQPKLVIDIKGAWKQWKRTPSDPLYWSL